MNKASTALFALALVTSAAVVAQRTDGIELLAKFSGPGLLVASTIGRGPANGSEVWYGSYLYFGNTMEVVAVDLSTGSVKVLSNPTKTESGARCMITGPDGNIYLGTLPSAHFVKIDTKTEKLVDLGRPSQTEEYIWDVAFGSDGKLYGATYPQSKLVRYDLITGKLDDLGRMDEVEQYAHYIAGSDDGFLYIGIGTSRQNIVAYQIASGKHHAILPPEYQTGGQAKVQRGTDGKAYGIAGSLTFRLDGWIAAPVGSAPPVMPKDRMHDGAIVSVDDFTLHIMEPLSKSRDVTFRYTGNQLPIFRLCIGPDNDVYASTELPIHFLRFDEERRAFAEIGRLGDGEVYSFAAQDGRLLLAAYSAIAPLMSFDTSQPFRAGTNPILVNYEGSDAGWRPVALLAGPAGEVYAGAVAGYGKLGGPLITWDTTNNHIEQNQQIITDQSISTLVDWKGLIIAGTTIIGGGGSHPTQNEGHLFLWDPNARKVVFDTVPLPGATTLNDFVIAPDGLLYGIGGESFFVFDPRTRTVKARGPLHTESTIYNAAAVGPDGRIWGLASSGIFAIDTRTAQATLIAKPPFAITAGFALRGNAIYFAHGAELYRYRLPGKEQGVSSESTSYSSKLLNHCRSGHRQVALWSYIQRLISASCDYLIRTSGY